MKQEQEPEMGQMLGVESRKHEQDHVGISSQRCTSEPGVHAGGCGGSNSSACTHMLKQFRPHSQPGLKGMP